MYKFLLKRKIKKLLKSSEREKAYLNLREIKSILVLFDTENFNDANHFIQLLKNMGKQIKVIAFKNKNDNNFYTDFPYTIITEKDAKSLNNYSFARIVKSLTEGYFDLVVDLTLKENLPLIYLLVSANSHLKVGFYKNSLSVHDMVISFAPDLVQNLKELGEQLIHYLTVISSK